MNLSPATIMSDLQLDLSVCDQSLLARYQDSDAAGNSQVPGFSVASKSRLSPGRPGGRARGASLRQACVFVHACARARVWVCSIEPQVSGPRVVAELINNIK
jgi:hypothetical protein